MMKDNHHKLCYMCSGNRFSYRYYHGKPYIYCLKCGLLWRDPPEEDSTYYYENINPTEKINRGKTRLYHSVLKKAERLSGRTGRVLDVGCGVGHFLKIAKRRGWETYGLDVVQKQVETAQRKGITAETAKLADESITDGESVDLITYWDVFMFVDNPLEELQTAFGKLTPGGQIYLRVRNHRIVRLMDSLWRKAGNFLPMKNPAVYQPFNYEARTISMACERLRFPCTIENGALTRGDPYSVSRKAVLNDKIKESVWRIAAAAEKISNRKVFLSPTLDIWISR